MAGETYLSAGVDLQGLEDLKERIKAFCRATYRPQVSGADRGFAGVYPLGGYKTPALVASTDGVGTKIRIAFHLGHYESIGIDLVNLNANDVLTWGARPLFFLDYISMSKLNEQAVEAVVRGSAWACRQIDCALLGGETALMPGSHSGDELELAGFLVGAVEQDHLLDSSTIVEGDVLLGVPSSGLHTNGYSLVRRVFGVDENPSVLYQRYPELGHTLGEELLIPHRCYYREFEPILPLVKGIAHITGGGLPGKLPSILPSGLAARMDPGTWEVHPIFGLIEQAGRLEREEMYRVFNMGLGMVIVCSQDKVGAIRSHLPEVVTVGEVVQQEGSERLSLGG